MTETTRNDIWAIIGKISLVIGAMVGVFTIWSFLKPTGQKITVQCTAAATEIPPDIKNVFDKIKESNSRDNIKAVITQSKIRLVNKADLSTLADALSEHYYKSIPDGYRYSLPSYSSYYEITITNAGSLAIEDATLSVPFEAVSILTSPEESKKAEFINRSLKLGAIRPKGKMRVQLWSTSGYSYINEENFILYHKGGTVPVDFPYTVWGFFGWLDKYWPLVLFLGFLLVYGVITTIPQILRYFKSSPESLTQSAQPTNEQQSKAVENA